MNSYTSRLAVMVLEPIHPRYLEAAESHARELRRPGRKKYAHEMICPYCGEERGYRGVFHVGGRRLTVTDVPLRPDGYEVPGRDGLDTELVLVQCQNPECEADVDPLAYFSPAVFYRDRTNIDLVGDEEEAA